MSVWFILALRLTRGYCVPLEWARQTHCRWAGYLQNAPPANGSPAADLFVAMGGTEWFVAFVNVAVRWREVLIGLGLIVGLLTRRSAFWGALLMLLFYLGNWNVAHDYISGDFAYLLVFLSVAALGAGRILGLDASVKKHEVGGQPLIERCPRMRYVLR